MTSKILVVDDSPLIRLMVRRALVQAGAEEHRICEAENGAVALEQVVAGDFSAILLDLNMPVMDGETFLRRLRAEHPELNPDVLIVSTESNAPRILGLRGLGISGFLGKPFEPEALQSLVKERLEVLADSEPTAPEAQSLEGQATPVPVAEAESEPPAYLAAPFPIEELDQAVRKSLEAMAFVLVDPSEDEAPYDALHRWVEFSGEDVRGRLRVSGAPGIAREVAAGMTGLDEEELAEDALGQAVEELTNILAGRVLVLLGGEERPFQLGIPALCPGPELDAERTVRRFDSMGEILEVGLVLEKA